MYSDHYYILTAPVLTLKATSEVVLIAAVVIEMSLRHYGNLLFLRAVAVVALPFLWRTQHGECITDRYKQHIHQNSAVKHFYTGNGLKSHIFNTNKVKVNS